jgi:hypothetical protein
MKFFVAGFFLISLGYICAYSQESTKFDEFGRIPCDEYLAIMDEAIQRASEDPTAKVYFFVYEGKVVGTVGNTKRQTVVYPYPASAKAKIRSMKKLVSVRKAPIQDFEFIDGGYRDAPAVEIWLVPHSAVPPRATPTIAKMRLRKGRPRGFCTSCCGE